MKINTSKKGSISEGMVLAALVRMGYAVSVPFDGTLRYDLIFDDGSLNRVQCKTGILRDGTVRFSSASCQRDTKVRSNYQGEVEYFGVYCPDNDKVYLIPIGDVPNNHTCSLRLEPAKNGQTKGIRWASEYLLDV